jgi:adenylate cyclase
MAAGVDREALAAQIHRRLQYAGIGINWVGALLVAFYLVVVFPPPEDLPPALAFAATLLYLVWAAVTGERAGDRLSRPSRDWLLSGRPPTTREREDAVRLPLRLMLVSAYRWGLGTVLGAAAVLVYGLPAEFAAEVATTTALAGLTVVAALYLTDEWIVRPAVTLALGHQAPPAAGSLGIGARLIFTWMLCSAVPVLMLALVPLRGLPDDPAELVAPIWFLCALALVAGVVSTKLTIQAVSRPVRSLRRAMDEVAAGRLDVAVPVDDGSEIGRLQARFNAMVGDLRERDHLRELFGRQVGIDVAREALERGIALGGEEREASALFVDVIGSTRLAVREPAERVVAMLNRFFTIVVEVVHAHGGTINKFEGDAALCVFGAPAPQRDHAARALAAARALHDRLDALDDVPPAAIGVATGTVVAGFVGAAERCEWTIIGDPVNEAARLTERAKDHPARLVASGAAVRAAGEPEAAHWNVEGDAVLRGRDAPTRLAYPLAA